MLDPEVVLRADAAAGPTALPVTLRGVRDVAKGALLAAQRIRFTPPALVNGTPGLVMAPRGRLFLVLAFTYSGDRISEVDVIADPGRLRWVELGVL